MAAGDIYELTFHQRVHNVPCVNVFWYEETDASTDGIAQLIQAFLDKAIVEIRSQLAVEWVPVCVEVRRVLPEPSAPRYGIIPPGSEGTDSGECFPANMVIVITDYTAETSKKGRGRIFQSGVSEDQEGKNNLSAERVLGFQSYMNAITQGLTGNVPDGIWERRHSSPSLATFLPIEAVRIRTPFKKLSSRMPRIC